ncbi:L-threonylcarbamoyladenylate synthase [Sphingomonas zeicaulis]|uniref:L-threonylcarbamoyladenylate synthase n=1 Tax=Sphingomonas zeicaulis TaxID=1632740 RepID=UPI003D1D1964
MHGSNGPFTTEICRYGTAAIARAAAVIGEGGTVAIPTETVYGLAADSTDGEAVARIYAAKGRPSFNPLIVHVADVAAAARLAAIDPVSQRLIDAFWPGPLTLVLPLVPDSPIASIVTAGLPTVAIRCPAHRAMRDLLAACGRPLAAPSANPSGGISATRAEHVMAGLGGRIPLIVDDGATAMGLESTIAAAAPDHMRLLRPGPITAEQLGEAAGGLPVVAADGGSIEAPGQLSSHYAPGTPLAIDVIAPAADSFVIGFGEADGDINLSPSADLVEAAAGLFDALHRADASGRTSIAVRPIPQDGLGAAINDRLRRAAHRD